MGERLLRKNINGKVAKKSIVEAILKLKSAVLRVLYKGSKLSLGLCTYNNWSVFIKGCRGDILGSGKSLEDIIVIEGEKKITRLFPSEAV